MLKRIAISTIASLLSLPTVSHGMDVQALLKIAEKHAPPGYQLISTRTDEHFEGGNFASGSGLRYFIGFSEAKHDCVDETVEVVQADVIKVNGKKASLSNKDGYFALTIRSSPRLCVLAFTTINSFAFREEVRDSLEKIEKNLPK